MGKIPKGVDRESIATSILLENFKYVPTVQCHPSIPNNFELHLKRLNKVMNHQETGQLYELYGNQKVADLLNKGCSRHQLFKLQWWERPEWLYFCPMINDLSLNLLLMKKKLLKKKAWFPPRILY